jgi:methanogenic corrinoid protein MtbC1
MLRIGTLEARGGGPGALAVVPVLAARALGRLASERSVNGTAGLAIDQFCAALLEDAPQAAHEYVDRLIGCGVGVEAIYDAFIPRAAARLGDLWLDDRLGFAGVTLGMARLTEVFRRLSPSFLKGRPAAPVADPLGRQALFALAPGESHALGVVMAADYFHRHGWSVRVELQADGATLERIVRAQPFDLVGLSAGSRRMIPDLRRTVRRLRAAARPSARFALGGALATLEPDIARQVGADCAYSAAQEAVEAIK